MTINQETLIETENVRVRVMNLNPGESTPLHHHSKITDHMVGLDGELRIKLKSPDKEVVLKPGTRYSIQPGRVHQVINKSSNESASYLLIQGVGQYDFKT